MAKQKIKIDPITQAKQAIEMFESMKSALTFLNTSCMDMIEFNINHAKKSLANLEAKENKEFEGIPETPTKLSI